MYSQKSEWKRTAFTSEFLNVPYATAHVLTATQVLCIQGTVVVIWISIVYLRLMLFVTILAFSRAFVLK